MSDWLEKLGMSQYAQRFVDRGLFVRMHQRECVRGADCSRVAVSLAGHDLAADITFDDVAARSGSMNYLRTAILLAGLTALFMAVGYLIGGGTGR